VQLLLIRHGETERAESQHGPADPPLTGAGLLQARRLADWLTHHERITVVYVSPLQRARQTARPLTDNLGITPIVLPELAEFDATSSSYIPMEELRSTRHPRLAAMVEGRWDELGSTVSPEEFRASIVQTLDTLAARHQSETVAVVCHGAVINAYLGDVIGTPRLLWFEPRYTSLHRVLVSRNGVRSVESVNELPHLDPRGVGRPG
jgi:probable phosphoglycerate mutase